ncbi:hypothetical protein BIY26_23045 [Brenneria goodwinii]|uniref:Uncharacterized protein n=1 Tax=Brenneria goodwinii TaxID=1109412 RepID=A0AAE8JKX3_9GAMM|nr:hypothetical protein AWC36_18595 [Brenneria goodwinii]RLM15524.1 hypothetical protein BIY26_23045 [Brenneria goodwinii]
MALALHNRVPVQINRTFIVIDDDGYRTLPHPDITPRQATHRIEDSVRKSRRMGYQMGGLRGDTDDSLYMLFFNKK